MFIKYIINYFTDPEPDPDPTPTEIIYEDYEVHDDDGPDD